MNKKPSTAELEDGIAEIISWFDRERDSAAEVAAQILSYVMKATQEAAQENDKPGKEA